LGLYLRNNSYYFKKQIQGKAYYRALNLKRGQEGLLSARLKQVEEEILASHYGIPYSPHKEINFLDYVEKYVRAKKGAKKTWDRDRQRLLIIGEYWEDLPLSRIGKSHIKKLEKNLFTRKLKHGTTPRKMKSSTVNRYFEVLKHFFSLAIEDEYLKENPCRYYQRFVDDGYRRALSKEELKQILGAAKKIQTKPKSSVQSLIYDLIVFALNTGMRLSEILNLKKSYIQDDVIFYPLSETKYRRRVRSQVNKKVKVICLNTIAKVTIQKMKSKDDYIFPIKWRNSNVVFNVVHKIRKLSKVKDFTFHQLRHTVSTVISSQVSLATAKTVLGHADLKTTLKYTHPGIEEQKRSVAKLGEYFSDLYG